MKKSHGGCINIDTIERGAGGQVQRRKIIRDPPYPSLFFSKEKESWM